MSVGFQPGRFLITPGAQRVVSEEEVAKAIKRHLSGDWGNVCQDDWAQNDWSTAHNARIISVYESTNGIRFWIITEADRSATTVLLPEEY